ncbi:MAG: hypothetical protein A3G18_03390 [Rhodospirillales bacterium RIFCSPLOWO2_12_FULL_58_28]|nr:MAG: hypothetical protein A3H92_03335 [Rhodospirillales bacterium RIFCSPLOWO2_02_FULL_58_16]OHC77321.1 MAG: hypothetical protein A3G18_03390 [Rhodospirillales bacterium RIFCSPLOWO2_12_FULL_58_28]
MARMQLGDHNIIGSAGGRLFFGRRLGRRLTSWLLTSVLALNILAASALPGAKIGNAQSPSKDRTSFSVFCTANGPQLVKVDANGMPVPNEKAAEKLCDFCLPFSKLVLLAPQQTIDSSALDLTVARLRFPIIGSADASAVPAGPLQPRAPPSLSA